MTIGIVIALVVLLGGALVVAVARDPGPPPSEVAIGYARALATADFDAVYRLTDADVLHGRNRPQWIAEQERLRHAGIEVAAVRARSTVETTDDACVVLDVDRTGGTAAVELVRRQRIWVVRDFRSVPTSPPT